ncbi:MAG: chemotaxis protein CheR [Prolixibacteraceae bacterium]|nr:chemotaxis protein CheR [Prolixibacteraceae bacterium]
MKSEFIEISDELFLKVGKMITEKYGIKMPLEKKIMFQSRLQRRLRDLDMDSFDEYAMQLFSDSGESMEFNLLADFISTNKTEFFREKEHFRFLTENILPEYLENNTSNLFPDLNFWSAGCSSGQEAYSIGIQIEEFMRLSGIQFKYSILATDISGKMLRFARDAVYPMLEVDEMPIELKHRYFLKSKNSKDPKVKVVKAIRERVKVGYLNLMDSLYPFDAQFDVVFLRNTLIYFDQMIQLKVLTRVLGSLKTGGYLFIGHSESLINLHLPIKSIAPSVYIKINTEGL